MSDVRKEGRILELLTSEEEVKKEWPLLNEEEKEIMVLLLTQEKWDEHDLIEAQRRLKQMKPSA